MTVIAGNRDGESNENYASTWAIEQKDHQGWLIIYIVPVCSPWSFANKREFGVQAGDDEEGVSRIMKRAGSNIKQGLQRAYGD